MDYQLFRTHIVLKFSKILNPTILNENNEGTKRL